MRVCPECETRSDFLSRQESCSSKDVLCPWKAVTQTPDPIMDDPKVYEIDIVPGNNVDKSSLVAVSKAARASFIEAKAILTGPKKTIFSGRADEVLEKKKALDNAGVKHAIVPEFPY